MACRRWSEREVEGIGESNESLRQQRKFLGVRGDVNQIGS